jgi:phosphoribosylaminoimidazole-succinocarboxamide synthase
MERLPLPHLRSGKVRDIYEVDHDRLLLVATDRMSTYDVVHDDPVPDKGRVLTGLSTFWFEQTADLVPNHLVSADPTDLPEHVGPWAWGRSMLVERATVLPIECVVRGYLFGSAWREYSASGTVNGAPLPAGLRKADRLPAPMFTPSTKADVGEHDLPLDESAARALVGDDRYAQLRDASIALYERAARHAEARGVLVADTKFEFGVRDGALVLVDEALTPDSSRFWAADTWEPGGDPPSFDKQFVRDYVDSVGWDHEPPAPRLPADVVQGTRLRYRDIYERLSGRSLDAWWGGPDAD